MSKKNQSKNNNRFQALSNEDNEEFKKAFELFDRNKTGKINTNDLIKDMQSLGFNERNPFIFNFFSELDQKGGINYNDFNDAFNTKLQDENSEKGIKKIFELFNNDSNTEIIKSTDLFKIKNELEEIMTKEEFSEIKRLAESGNELNFRDFYEIMTKKE